MNTNHTIEKEMSEFPWIAEPGMGIAEAVDLMAKQNLRHLPVVDRGKVVGVVSDRDLRQAKLIAKEMPITVVDVMTSDPYCVRVGTPLATVAVEMANKKYGCTVIIGNRGQIVGIFTTTDGMRILGELLTGEAPPHLRLFGIEKLLKPEYLI